VHIAHKVVMLYEGSVYMEGKPELFERSDDPLVRQFLTGSLDGPMKV